MKLGFVVQRYGKELSGGAEQHARMLAHQLKREHEIEIITTCAADYTTWKNVLPPGEAVDDGISVKRFATDFERDKTSFDRLTEKLLRSDHSQIEEIEWLVHQGPYSEQLFRFLREHQNDYDYLVFYTYLYITTVFGMMINPSKSLLVPTAHDEPVISFTIFNALFHLPRGIMFLTEGEKEFVLERFKNGSIPSALIGTGISPVEQQDRDLFRRKLSISGQFLLYLGRVDEGKGCKELADYFLRYIEQEKDEDLTLVLAGSHYMPEIHHPQVMMPGFLSEDDKQLALAGAHTVISPSRYESLSLLVLDAFNAGTPVLASGHCRVVRQHIEKSGAGFTYESYDEFRAQLNQLLQDQELRFALGQKGKEYIDRSFRWETVVRNVQSLLIKLGD